MELHSRKWKHSPNFSRECNRTKHGGLVMVGLFPRLSAMGIADYFGIAVGLSLGWAIFSGPMSTLEINLKKGA